MGKQTSIEQEVQEDVKNVQLKIYTPMTECVMEVSQALQPYRESINNFQSLTFAKIGKELVDTMLSFNKVAEKMIESASAIANSYAQTLYKFTFPKIKLPRLSEKTRQHLKFIEIASVIGFPIFFEIDTELQDKLISICGDYLEEYYPTEEIKQCIYEYYNCEMLMEMLNVWNEQEWITVERKKALQEAIEVYQQGYYFSTGSIMMCQLGGLINDLFTESNFTTLMTLEDRKNVNSLYNVGKLDSEKGRVLQMMSVQESGVIQWYKSAEYMMHHTYSSSEDITLFEYNPGRHKICHGEQTNYGTKEHALKAILVVDIVIQLGEQMLREKEINA